MGVFKIVYPEEFQARNDGTGDDSGPIIAAWKAVSEATGNVGKLMLGPGRGYRIKSPIPIEASFNSPAWIDGAGSARSRIIVANDFVGDVGMHITGQPSNGQTEVMDLNIGNFAIVSENPSSQGGIRKHGMQFGSAGKQIGGLKKSIVHDLVVDGFESGIVVGNTTEIQFDRLGIWMPKIDGAIGLAVAPYDKAGSTSDITFNELKVVPSDIFGVQRQRNIKLLAPYETKGCAGIYLIHPTLYPPIGPESKHIEMIADKSNLSEIYLIGGGQSEGIGAYDASIHATTANGGQIYNTHVKDHYFQGIAGRAIYWLPDRYGGIHGWQVKGCTIRGNNKLILEMGRVLNCQFSENIIEGVPQQTGYSALVSVHDSHGITMADNSVDAMGSPGVDCFASVTGGSSSFTGIGNNAVVRNDRAVTRFARDNTGNPSNIYAYNRPA